MGSVFHDLRFGFRMAFRHPGLTVIALLSLAIGIGANTTIFSVVNAILLRPFPVNDPGRLAVVYERNLQRQDQRTPTAAFVRELRQHARSFETMAFSDFGGTPATLTGPGEAARITFGAVSTNFFSVAGVAPVLGRAPLPEDALEDFGSALILSHGFWQRQFHGDKSVIGQTMAVEGMKMTVIGVMPAGFWLFPWERETDAWSVFNPAKNPNSRWLLPIGRLKEGVTIEQAQAEVESFFRPLAQQQPNVYKNWGVRVESLQEWAVGSSRQTLYLLLGAVGFVLLIACANVANLLLSRAAARQKEIAVRTSLGAGRFRLIRQLLTESMALALVGGLLGVLAAAWGIDLFVVLAPQWFPRTTDIRIDTTVLWFSLLLSLLTGLLFGLAPAIQASRPDLNESLKEAGGRSAGGSRSRSRSVLMVSEVALALVLLMGAGLMINSFIRLQNVGLGFDTRNLLTAEIFLAGPKYWTPLEGDMKRVTLDADLFFQELLERVKRLPGVTSASIGNLERMDSHPFRIAGKPSEPSAEQPSAPYAEVSPGFFQTMGIPLLKGRALSDRDVDGAPWAVVVSESFARRFFPNEDPLGKILYMSIAAPGANRDIEEGRPREIVGVVGDVRYWGPQNGPQHVIYGSYRQHPTEYAGGSYAFHLWKKLVIRTSADPASLTTPLHRIVADMDRDQVLFGVKTMEEELSEFVAEQRFWMRLFGVFAGLAIFLAVVGIYGVISYSVSRRTHEIGVRIANGASSGDIFRLIVGYGLRLTLLGVLIGVAGSVGLTRLVGQFLYEVKPTDPPTYALVSILLTAVAVTAAYLPARRATKVDPMDALRYE